MRYKSTVALKRPMSLSLWHCGKGRTVVVVLPGLHKITLEGIMTVQSVC